MTSQRLILEMLSEQHVLHETSLAVHQVGPELLKPICQAPYAHREAVPQMKRNVPYDRS